MNPSNAPHPAEVVAGAAGGEIPDLITVEVPAGAQVLVVSDLHLGSGTGSCRWAASELARRLETWPGPGIIVLAGDTVELLSEPGGACNEVDDALISLPRLHSAFRQFVGGPGRRMVCLVGNHDARIAWDAGVAQELRRSLRVDIALAADLTFPCPGGAKVVRVEHGHRLDPLNSFRDPRNPRDTPLGYHVVKEILPGIDRTTDGWFDGSSQLVNPASLPTFAISRLVYRKLIRHLWWLAVPFALALTVRVPVLYALLLRTGHASHLGTWSHRLMVLTLAAVLDLGIIGAALFLSVRRVWTALREVLGVRGKSLNESARAEAQLLAAGGYAGLITGHTHHPELTSFGDSFYANAGSAAEVVTERRARFGFPPVFAAQRQVSWVEMSASPDLKADLVEARIDLPPGTGIERMLAIRDPSPGDTPATVASFPGGPFSPEFPERGPDIQRVRNVAAAAIALSGLLNLVAAVTPPLKERLEHLLDVVPLAVPQAAAALVALAGLGLLLLAGGLRRGQRHAWSVALFLLFGSTALHLIRGVDYEEALVALGIGLYLARYGAMFRAPHHRASVKRGLIVLTGGAAVAVAAATVAVEAFPKAVAGGHIPWTKALMAVSARLIGLTPVALTSRLDAFLTVSLPAVGLAILLAGGLLLFAPVRGVALGGPGEKSPPKGHAKG